MSRQEREGEIKDALKVLRKQQSRAGKKGSRDHQEVNLDRVAKITALNSGPCSVCQGLKIIIYVEGSYHSPDVSLGCSLKKSPLGIHLPYATQPGEIPECSSQVPFEESEELLTA